MDNQFVLRYANINDINALSELSYKTYRETYIEDLSVSYPEKDLNKYLSSSASPQWFANKINDPNQSIWVIEDKTNGEIVAFAVAGSCATNDVPHPDVCSSKDGTLDRLYIRRDKRSLGFGKQLMNVILNWFEEHYPGRPIWLTLYSENVKAQKFYEHYGFTKVGEWGFPVGKSIDLDFIMKREPNIL